jgi:aldose sugar dehydrogenase
VAVDPDFAKNGLVYVSYTEAGTPAQGTVDDDPRFAGFIDKTDNFVRGGAVARGRLVGNALRDVKVVWRQEPKQVGRGHFGHRLVFAPDGTLFITSGERMRFDPAQDLSGNLGKVVRINPDGTLPKDNPFAGKDGARGDVFSLGHRNILAAAIHPPSGKLWVLEMGPFGGDELNVIAAGKNYGWPVVSNGSNYDKSDIPDHPTRPELAAPVRTWTPVISPSGLAFYGGSLFPTWRGSLLAGGLSSKALVRLALDGERVVDEERIDMKRRIRDVIEAPDGAVLVIVDDPKGDLLRLTPAPAR